jgi:hypothetical protein
MTLLFPVLADVSRAAIWTLHSVPPDFIDPLCNAGTIVIAV